MRLVNRAAVLFLGTVVSSGLVACGGDDGGGDDDDTVDPAGTNHTYVVSRLRVPGSVNEATQFGLDIDDVDGDTMNGIDNSLGTSLGTFAGQGLNLQPGIDTSVDDGSIMLLTNIKATDLTNASGVGMWVYLGGTSTPPACDSPADTTCRKHLTGSATFTLDPAGPTNALLVGRIMAGKFTGGPGTINLQLSLAEGQPPVDLPLQMAKAELNIGATGIATGSKIGGAILQSDIETKIHPAIQQLVTGIFEEDCGPLANRTPPGCGCMSGSTGASVLSFLDTAMPKDCDVSLAEVTSTLNSLLTTDMDLLDASGNPGTDGVNDSVSLGIGVQAVKGTYTLPAQ